MRKITHKRSLLVAVAALVVAVICASVWFGNGKPRRFKLSITAGSTDGLRHRICQSLGEHCQTRNVDLQIVPTDGSGQAIDWVNSGRLDLALLQGGMITESHPNVRQAATLHIEPLHLLAKPAAARSGPDGARPNPLPGSYTLVEMSRRIKADSAIRINVSTPSSGTYVLATELLGFFGLVKDRDYQATYWTYHELVDPDVKTIDLPEAVFTVSSLPSPVARHLITNHGYRPVELPISQAFRMDWPSESLQPENNRRVKRKFLVNATIPAFTYQVTPPVPDRPVPSLGTRLQLVANIHASPEAVMRVVDAIYQSPLATVPEPPLSIQMLRSSQEIKLHAGAEQYLKQKTPIVTENVIELTEQVLAILGTVCGAFLFTWQGMLFIRRRRRDRQFLSCIERIGNIETQAMSFDQNEAMTVDDLVDLQAELNNIKSDIIAQFQSGDIDGADTLSGFLMHVNNANENLTRMILHERGPRSET